METSDELAQLLSELQKGGGSAKAREEEDLKALWYEVLQHPLFRESRAVSTLSDDGPQKRAFDLAREIASELEREQGSEPLPTDLEIGSDLQPLLSGTLDGSSPANWNQLLDGIKPLPLRHSRSVWVTFLLRFPRVAFRVVEYLELECVELGKLMAEESNPEVLFRSTMRILHVFHRHLSLCASVDLYSFLFEWLRKRTDNRLRQVALWGTVPMELLEKLYNSALSNVGCSLDARSLWLEATTFRLALRATDSEASRREWQRQQYHKMLSLPLDGLDQLREQYNSFEKGFVSERNQTFQLEDWLEKTFIRVQKTILPERKWLYERRTPKFIALEKNLMSNAVFREWEIWEDIVAFERRTESFDQFNRIFLALRQRLSVFPTEPACWVELLEFLTERNDSRLPEFIKQSLDALPSELLLSIRQTPATPAMNRINAVEAFLHRSIVELDKEPIAERVQTLSKMVLTAATVMHWALIHFGLSGNQAMRILAKSLFLEMRFPALVVNIAETQPARQRRTVMRLFTFFMTHWVTLELRWTRDYSAATKLLQRWILHIRAILRHKVDWSPEDCGLSPVLSHLCQELIVAAPEQREDMINRLYFLWNDLRQRVSSETPFDPTQYFHSMVVNVRCLRLDDKVRASPAEQTELADWSTRTLRIGIGLAPQPEADSVVPYRPQTSKWISLGSVAKKAKEERRRRPQTTTPFPPSSALTPTVAFDQQTLTVQSRTESDPLLGLLKYLPTVHAMERFEGFLVHPQWLVEKLQKL